MYDHTDLLLNNSTKLCKIDHAFRDVHKIFHIIPLQRTMSTPRNIYIYLFTEGFFNDAVSNSGYTV